MIAHPVRRYNPVSAYAYPGHEALREAMAALVARLASRHLPESRVEDPSREVFWNEWIEDSVTET